ncbi:hypothetical protein SMKI_04G0230 [Saccharomyces mikatae IFO 1815]|uniref:Telomeric single stranded DNA binding POT1/Cdc13 domain-containing protein n=1 Tax=Saccharomyces mikatae IFO 1815 TaxID=226126 RepID=A0AA35IVH0_SACMI|nr:uncharacterized protein SMKI_04G0230 [Saccharomyces mikatae IFO 1815]CAI4037693.1 hypothetical protein SMKI_04G0230 [Saccharomyces mikatae IFO 1815]
MDTLEEPECPEHEDRVFVKSSKDFEGYASKAIVPVHFVALLTSIYLTETKGLLVFSNFEEGESQVEKDQYIIKLKFKDRSSERLARMTISLLCQYFDIELPDLDSGSTLILKDIHLERLCFSSCKALYVSRSGNYTLFLEDIKPLDIVNVINSISTKSQKSGTEFLPSGPIIESNLREPLLDIFNNLIKMNIDERNSFKFVRLIHYNTELKKFIQEQQSLLSQKSKTKLINPFFAPNRLGIPYVETQNEFNSQLMTLNSEQPITDISSNGDDMRYSTDPIEESDSSTISSTGKFVSPGSCIQSHTPERKTSVPNNWLDNDSEGKNKRRLSFQCTSAPSSQQIIDYERLSLAKVGSVERLKGKFVGMYPSHFSGITEFRYCTLKLYFTHLSVSKIPDKILIPGTNCIEIIIPTMERIRELFGVLNCQNSMISNILLLDKPDPISVEIERVMWNNDETISPGLTVWSLKNISVKTQAQASAQSPAKSLPPVNAPRTKMRKMAEKDPTIEFCHLELNTFETKYVTMFGMLVSCSFDKPAFVSFVFTDFTTNDIVQNYLYDRYLVDYEAKLELNEGFKAIMYRNQFETFDSKILNIFNKRLNELQNGRDENLSQHGIVCKMNIKVKIYNGKLNAIVRECVPVLQSQVRSVASPSQSEHLRSFYQRAFKRIGESAISRYFEEYQRFFPIQRNKTSHLAQLKTAVSGHEQDHEPGQLHTSMVPTEYIPDLNADVSSFDIECTDIFPLLNSLSRCPHPRQIHKTSTLYSCRGRIIAIEYMASDICFHITNEFSLSQGRSADSQKVLKLHIITPKNFAYFFNRPNAYIQRQSLEEIYTQLTQFLGHSFQFNITSSYKLLPETALALQIWCPIECTLRELQQQLAHLKAATTPDSGSLGYAITAAVNPPRFLAAQDGVTVKKEEDNGDEAGTFSASWDTIGAAQRGGAKFQ